MGLLDVSYNMWYRFPKKAGHDMGRMVLMMMIK
jgi:hypothetical protein